MKKSALLLALFSVLPSSTHAKPAPKVDVLGMLDEGYIADVSPSGRYLLLGRFGLAQFWLFDVNKCQKWKLPAADEIGFFINDRLYLRFHNGLRLSSTRTRRTVQTLHIPDEPSSVTENSMEDIRVSPDGREIWVLTALRLYRFSTNSGKLMSNSPWGDPKTRRWNHNNLDWCSLSANGHWIVSRENGWTMDEFEDPGTHNVKDEIIIYDVRTGQRTNTFTLNSSSVFSNMELRFTSVSGDIMQADDTRNFTYFQLPQGNELWRWTPKDDIPFVQPVSQRNFVTWLSPTGLIVRNLKTGRTLRRISNYAKTNGSPLFDRTGRYIFGMDRHGYIKRWHLK